MTEKWPACKTNLSWYGTDLMGICVVKVGVGGTEGMGRSLGSSPLHSLGCLCSLSSLGLSLLKVGMFFVM